MTRPIFNYMFIYVYIYIHTKIKYDRQKSKVAAMNIWDRKVFLVSNSRFLKGQGMYFCTFKLYTTYICKDIKNLNF